MTSILIKDLIKEKLIEKKYKVYGEIPIGTLYILYLHQCTCCIDVEISYKKLPWDLWSDPLKTKRDLESALECIACGGHYTNIRIGILSDNTITDITSIILGRSSSKNDDLDYYSL